MNARHIHWLAVGVFLSLFFFLTQKLGQTPASKAAQPATGQSSGWITHRDPQLYSVESPRGWNVSADRQKGWVRLAGTQGEEVVIWPVFSPGALDPAFAPRVHAQLAAGAPYKAQWENPQTVTGNTLRARGTSANGVAVSVFTWVPTPKGAAGIFYLVAAREADYRQRQADFARILESFRIIGAATQAETTTAGGVQYVKYTDPREGAFTMDAPAGWKTEGGLFRFHALDIRPVVESTSPDGQMGIAVGDLDYLSLFIEPMQFFPEGSVYAPYGLKMMVRTFPTGMTVCSEIVLRKVSTVCPNPQITEAKDLSDQIAKLAADRPQAPGLRTYRDSTLARAPRVTWGDVSFRCGGEAQAKTGRCQAITVLEPTGTRNWYVHHISGFLAPVGKEAVASTIWEHVRWSVQFDPQWETMEAQLATSAAMAVSRTSNEILDSWIASQHRSVAIDDAIAHRRSNATLGVVDVADPETGRRMTVESGSNYYWADQRGMVVGTNTDTHPGLDFRALLQFR
jgi:hypothetical protein